MKMRKIADFEVCGNDKVIFRISPTDKPYKIVLKVKDILRMYQKDNHMVEYVMDE